MLDVVVHANNDLFAVDFLTRNTNEDKQSECCWDRRPGWSRDVGKCGGKRSFNRNKLIKICMVRNLIWRQKGTEEIKDNIFEETNSRLVQCLTVTD